MPNKVVATNRVLHLLLGKLEQNRIWWNKYLIDANISVDENPASTVIT